MYTCHYIDVLLFEPMCEMLHNNLTGCLKLNHARMNCQLGLVFFINFKFELLTQIILIKRHLSQ